MNAVRLLLLIVIFAAVGGSALGQSASKPIFDGSWKLDTKKSKSVQMVGGPKKGLRLTSRLEVVHNGPELMLSRTTIWEELDKAGAVVRTIDSPAITSIYYTDGRGEKNWAFGNTNFESTTKWSGDTVVVHRPEPQLITSYTLIKISLSKDGKELKIITEKIVRPQEFGQREMTIDRFSGKEVYVRNEEANAPTSK